MHWQHTQQWPPSCPIRRTLIWPLDAFVCVTCQCKIERQFQCKHSIEMRMWEQERNEEREGGGRKTRNYCKRNGGAFVFLGRRLNFPAIKQAAHKAISTRERWGVSWYASECVCVCAGMCEPDAGTGTTSRLYLPLQTFCFTVVTFVVQDLRPKRISAGHKGNKLNCSICK